MTLRRRDSARDPNVLILVFSDRCIRRSDGGYFYGCPGIGNLGLKVAEHSGGTEIKDPLNDSDDTEETDDARIQNFVNNHIPNASSKKTAHKTCFYTMTHDEHFIVDRHPEHASVVFAAGLSGHGFKFTSALGKVLAELTMDEAPTCDINFLSLQSSRHRSS